MTLPFMLIDTHCHLTSRFFDNPEEVIKRAEEAGVEKLICIGTNLEDSREAVSLAQKNDSVYATVGIHPQESCDDWTKFEELAKSKKVVAIGECGLDYKFGLPEQKENFVKQIAIAQKLNFPLVIHSREATDDTLEILKRVQDDKLTGVFHFYSFGKSKIAKVMELGFYFGLDGNLTYEVGLQNVAKNLPTDKILLETDSPDLAPLPYRGSKNEPKNVKIVAQCLADVKGLNIDEVAKITTENAKKLFPNF